MEWVFRALALGGWQRRACCVEGVNLYVSISKVHKRGGCTHVENAEAKRSIDQVKLTSLL